MKTIVNRQPTSYWIKETYRAGISLRGREVKLIRLGRVSLSQAYGSLIKDEVFLCQLQLATEVLPPRKLLLKRAQIKDLAKSLRSKEANTLVVLKLELGRYIKVQLALAKGRKSYDKRQLLKARDHQRQIKSALKSGRKKLK